MNIYNSDFIGIIGICEDCGHEVHGYVSGSHMSAYRDINKFSHWALCPNASCENYIGEGYNESPPEWVVASESPVIEE